MEFPSQLEKTLKDLDLYDNLIAHIKGLDNLTLLANLDLSYNKIKHIRNLEKLIRLKDLYFVQNKISKIEGLEELTSLRNLELGGNRIRVGFRLCYLSPNVHREAGDREPGHINSAGRAVVGKEQDRCNSSLFMASKSSYHTFLILK